MIGAYIGIGIGAAVLLLLLVLIIRALRFKPHDSHFSVDEAMEIIREVKPRKAYLTHLSHEIGLHATSPERLSEGVELAYDGLTIEINE